MKRKMPDFSRLMPPGLDFAPEGKFTLFAFGASAVYSALFLLRYADAYGALFRVDRITRERTLIEGAVMKDFAELIRGTGIGFFLLCGCMVFFIVRHYLYHWRHAKSIYLMRRLPRRSELHRRCLTLPAVGILLSLLCAFLILLLYYGIYMLITPEICLTDGQWQKIWRFPV